MRGRILIRENLAYWQTIVVCYLATVPLAPRHIKKWCTTLSNDYYITGVPQESVLGPILFLLCSIIFSVAAN
jgi:hypothetical protein